MKISYSWLKEFLPGLPAPQSLKERLLGLGFETTLQRIPLGKFSGVVVGEICEILPHPNAERLRLAGVTDGKERFRLVCGAPNISIGARVPFAKVGAQVSGKVVQEAVIRGEKSPGMICSAKELDLGEDHEGILILPKSAPLGHRLEELSRFSETLLNVEVTPNRADCLSHLGLAREVAAALDKKIKRPQSPSYHKLKPPLLIEKAFPVFIQSSLCRRYIARVIENCVIAASLRKMARRLEALGTRSISNAVDITNYVLFEMGQPLHVFDLDKLSGRRIIVRQARKGESLRALDEKVYALEPSMLVIADEERPVALAGIIGGTETAVTNRTKNILLESAWFDPGAIRRTRSALGIVTESSYRFERGVSWENVEEAGRRAGGLILNLCGGRVTATTDRIRSRFSKPVISIHPKEISEFLGVPITPSLQHSILKRLECKMMARGKDNWRVIPPHYRLDLQGPADLCEEIARLYGYERIKSREQKAMRIALAHPSPLATHTLLPTQIRQILLGFGFYEAMVSHFATRQEADSLLDEGETILLSNPLSSQTEALSPTPLLGLLRAAARNLREIEMVVKPPLNRTASSHKRDGVRLFAVSKAFFKIETAVHEEARLAGLWAGPTRAAWWKGKPISSSFETVAGMIESLLTQLHVSWYNVNGSLPRVFHPGAAAKIASDGGILGSYGLIHPEAAAFWELPEETLVFDIALEALQKSVREARFQGLPRFPEVRRDIALELPEETCAAVVRQALLECGKPHLARVYLFDLYRGEGLSPGTKSMAWALFYGSSERTLTDEEVKKYHAQLAQALEKRLGAKVR